MVVGSNPWEAKSVDSCRVIVKFDSRRLRFNVSSRGEIVVGG